MHACVSWCTRSFSYYRRRAPSTAFGTMATGTEQLDSQNYNTAFDPDAYLREYFTSNINKFKGECPLQELHELYTTNCRTPRPVKVLDYGCGPAIAYVISAAAYASEIVLAEYTEGNRNALQLWMEKDPKAFDWTPFFDYVVQTLEGNSEKETREREDRLRRVVKAIVPCDVTQDNPIEKGYEGPYDVVSTSLCLESACKTLDEYVAALGKLSSLVKPGGTIAIYGIERATLGKTTFYSVGEERFQNVGINRDFLTTTLKHNGFCNVAMKCFGVKMLQLEFKVDDEFLGTMFVSASKSL